MRKNTRFILSAIVVLACVSSRSFASESENILRYAGQLKASGEYYRAITEYNRFNSYGLGTKEKRIQNMFEIADCYESGGQYADAQNVYTEIATKYPENRLLADIYRVRIYSKDGKYGESNLLIRNLLDQNLKSNEADMLRLSEGKNYIHLGQYGNAKNTFLSVADQGGDLSVQARNYVEILDQELPLKRKSKFTGMVLGILLPGGGYFYLQKPQTGLAALVVVGALGYSTYELFDRKIYGLGSLVGLATAGFYVGSLYGTAQGIKKYNNNKELGLTAKFTF